MSQQTLDAFSHIVEDLCSRTGANRYDEISSDDVRRGATLSLERLLLVAERDCTKDQFLELNSTVVARILHLISHGNSRFDRLGGIYALETLTPFDGVDISQRTIRFAQSLRTVLRGKDLQLIEAAAVALGSMCRPGGSLISELVKSEVQTALEWLQSDRAEGRRCSAVLVLRELSRSTPTLVYPFVDPILNQLFVGLHDSRLFIRQTSAEAFTICFQIIKVRDQDMRQAQQVKAYDWIIKGVREGTVESIHASLLIMKILLKQGGMFMHKYYQEASETILRYKDFRDVQVRRTVVSLIPDLAAYSPPEFAQPYMDKFMNLLIRMLQNDHDHNDAFLAIGDIATAMKSDIAPYLDEILIEVRKGLSLKSKRNYSVDPILYCITKLALAVGQTLVKYMDTLLDMIFACQLTPKLTQTLMDVSLYIPAVKSTIQERLLDMLSKILCGENFESPRAPTPNNMFATSISPKISRAVHARKNQAEVKLALTALRSFDFSGHSLNEFVKDVILKYVEDEDIEIRELAALTCCQLYVHDPIINQTSYHAVKVVSEVIETLLTVGVADSDPGVRKKVLAALDKRFDHYLAKAENIRTLLPAVNDEVFAIREVAITIISRLTLINPAYANPSLRRVLIQILTELEVSDVAKNTEECAILLQLLMHNAPRLIKPYVESIAVVLIPKARDPNPAVASATMQAFGELAAVAGEDMVPYMDKLMPIIIEALQDQGTSSKRKASLEALAKLAGSSGYVIKPYLDYPQLLDIVQNIIREPQREPLRQETIKLMGILGALDPYRHQQAKEESMETQIRVESNQITDVSIMMTCRDPSKHEYFQTVVMNALLNILRNPLLFQHHNVIIEAIVNIFRTLGLECVHFLDQIMPAFLNVIRNSPSNQLELLLNQLSQLVTIIRQHIRTFLPDIIIVIREHWHLSPAIQATILRLVDTLSQSLRGELSFGITGLIPLMLDVLENDTSPRRLPSERVLHTILAFGSSTEVYLYSVIPAIVSVFDKPQQPSFIRKSAIECIGRLTQQVNLSDHVSKIIHPLARILSDNDTSLQVPALDTLCTLIFQLGKDYLRFVGTIQKVLIVHQIRHEEYELLVSKLQKGEVLLRTINSPNLRESGDDEDLGLTIGNNTLDSNLLRLKASWDTTGKSTKDDWQEWMIGFSLEILAQSPNHALRACAGFATIYPALARELFNSAFLSCWTGLSELYRNDLTANIEAAIKSLYVTPDVLGILLNLAEFMEHDDKPLPISIEVLGHEAGKCHAWAKALHYKELELNQKHTSASIDVLIQINNQLQQHDAAIGILRKIQLSKGDLALNGSWFEKLEQWEEALAFYKKREKDISVEAEDFDITMGKMRCLHALGEWDLLSILAQDKWQTSSLAVKRVIAPLATAAAWGVGKWDLMDDYLDVMESNTSDRAFFDAILALHRNQFREAALHVQKSRDGLEVELSALIGESYNRAYPVIVRVQMLAEIEELVAYKQSNNDTTRQATMRHTWEKRLLGCQRNVEVWQRMLRLRSLVISPKENIQMSIKFANLCTKSGRMGLAEKGLKTLIGTNDSLDTMLPFADTGEHQQDSQPSWKIIPPHVTYAVLKYQWAAGKKPKALEAMKIFITEMSDRLEAARMPTQRIDGSHNLQRETQENVTSHKPIGDALSFKNPILACNDIEEHIVLLARCCLKRGEWQIALKHDTWEHDHISDILGSFQAATNFNPNWAKAWHAWAMANFEVIRATGQHPGPDSAITLRSVLVDHTVSAIRGFVNSITLSIRNSLQDTLRLLTLWFTHGGSPEVNTAVVEGFTQIGIDTWLEAIPQLIARINQPITRVRRSLLNLLADLGRAHPQALVYPLNVAMKSTPNSRRSRSALQIMESMRLHSPQLVKQAAIVSRELVRIAISWHEQWFTALEEASRLYFEEGSIYGMSTTLESLHILLERGPETLCDISFAQAYGRLLQEAREWSSRYKRSGDAGDINQAWNLYHRVYTRIKHQLPSLKGFEMNYVSPKLALTRDMDLAVPGTYQSSKPVIKILGFEMALGVMPSKQRPRKLTINGSNGTSYTFLLKGHEDMRQDERVMQLFGLCNTLLTIDKESYKRRLNIQTCAIIPLSQNSGLMSWFPNVDTLHFLIDEYRASRKILVNIESRMMFQMAGDYDNLTFMQKLEAFHYAQDNTTGQDLYRILWLKSKNSESWLERRTNYTRSLGVMSMIGYILGLGDRHPSNIMLNSITGNIIHIDFGDCFEVAILRERLPERVPFRLTRMLIYAMEIGHIEGSFRTTCENAMRVLRDDKESLMAVLEAFIHDPLLNWRLRGESSTLLGPNFPSETHGSPMPLQERRPLAIHADVSPSMPIAQIPFISPERSSALLSRGRSNTTSERHGELDSDVVEPENERALQVMKRIKEKLTGHDFKGNKELTCITQVDKLLIEATNPENLCQHYSGWCSFW